MQIRVPLSRRQKLRKETRERNMGWHDWRSHQQGEYEFGELYLLSSIVLYYFVHISNNNREHVEIVKKWFKPTEISLL